MKDNHFQPSSPARRVLARPDRVRHSWIHHGLPTLPLPHQRFPPVLQVMGESVCQWFWNLVPFIDWWFLLGVCQCCHLQMKLGQCMPKNTIIKCELVLVIVNNDQFNYRYGLSYNQYCLEASQRNPLPDPLALKRKKPWAEPRLTWGILLLMAYWVQGWWEAVHHPGNEWVYPGLPPLTTDDAGLNADLFLFCPRRPVVRWLKWVWRTHQSVLGRNPGDVLAFSPKRIISSSLSKGFIYRNVRTIERTWGLAASTLNWTCDRGPGHPPPDSSVWMLLFIHMATLKLWTTPGNSSGFRTGSKTRLQQLRRARFGRRALTCWRVTGEYWAKGVQTPFLTQ